MFYLLDADYLRSDGEGAISFNYTPRLPGQRIVCPIEPENHRGMAFPDRGWSMHVTRDQRIDFFQAVAGQRMFISGAALDVLQRLNPAKFSADPCEVTYGEGVARREPFFQLDVTGWGGLAQGSKLEERCPGCGAQTWSVEDVNDMIDESQWDGSDLFFAWPAPLYTFATNRVRLAFEEAGLVGARFYPYTSVRQSLPSIVDKGPSRRFSPGKLEFWLPPKRAKEIGEPLGIF